MSNEERNNLERHDELLVDRALLGLSAEEAEELRMLAPDGPHDADLELELAAALLHESFMSDDELEDMPAHLSDRIVQSSRFVVKPEAAASEAPTGPALNSQLPLAIGAVAALILAVIGVFAFSNVSNNDPAPVSVEVACAKFEKSTSDLSRSDWKTVEDGFAKVEGFVSWSKTEQKGYMHLRGLPKNDAAKAQYQLWIVDGKRDGAPVDGGVFNVNADGEVIVPIDAKLRVADAKAFVITKEVPGGVVVSKGPHLVLAAL